MLLFMGDGMSVSCEEGMREALLLSIQESQQAIKQLESPRGIAFIEEAAKMMADCFRNGGKVLVAGNGGSLCDAAHIAEELTGLFRKKRRALPAIALNDPGHLTCVANDMGFEHVFARSVEAFGKKEDLFIGLTTSGNSTNLIQAFDAAKVVGMKSIAFLGKGGGKLLGKASLELVIDGFKTSDRIQEAHMAAGHMIIELVEHHLSL